MTREQEKAVEALTLTGARKTLTEAGVKADAYALAEPGFLVTAADGSRHFVNGEGDTTEVDLRTTSTLAQLERDAYAPI